MVEHIAAGVMENRTPSSRCSVTVCPLSQHKLLFDVYQGFYLICLSDNTKLDCRVYNLRKVTNINMVDCRLTCLIIAVNERSQRIVNI